ncbi:hypothetical protein VNO78_36385 [Psophocarpus tetragonolobus]|uniref:Uncharacterized protein n=1 Tax=Psophocarpus tetragonolobus TaxID=3891 RepID=A0AAN9RG96_PSOTE
MSVGEEGLKQGVEKSKSSTALKGQAEEQPLGRPIDSSIPPDGIAAAKRAERRRAQGRHLIRFATSL